LGQDSVSLFFTLPPQLLQTKALDFRQPKYTRPAPTKNPQGKKKNMQINPATSKPTPSRSVCRRVRIVATVASLPGSRIVWPQFEQRASMPTSSREYERTYPQKRQRQVSISPLTRPLRVCFKNPKAL
jgi:hypothetical protein